ncbi:ferrochelatase [Paenibacillus validus]|uniref:ferrochelatase n=1 Tax=Paenibacillus validus TaxID=44253 RepID=UPI000FDB3E60|nr:ferrochelatase [Paenibacillus validus]MED4599789.1 ferrochelatase [Paenibacillus validus]MED4604676.1 ferrochelatase [Paenibacillus validus]
MRALLLFAYGIVESIDELEAFYTHIFNGNPPSSARLLEGMDRYRSIGINDPLGSVTLRQASALERRLAHLGIQIFVACKHTEPLVEEAVSQIVKMNAERLYALSLAPLYTRTGTGARLVV